LEAEVNKIKDLAKKAIEHNQGLYTKDGKIRNHKNKIKLDQIEEKINSNTSVSRFVKMYGIRDFLRTVRPKGKQWTPTEASRWTTSYYQAFIESCTEILECISDAQLDIETHINEERRAPEFNLVSLYLINQNIPGRINVIRQKNPVGYQYIADNYPEHVKHIKNLFEAQLNNSTLLMTKHFESNDSSKLLFRIRWLFGKHDTDGLYKLASHLETKTNNDKNLSHLARGLGLELNDRFDEAASEYQQVAAGAGLEDALVHLSRLLIERGDTDNAILALECLTHLSPIYMPQHAELLYLTGNVHGALDEYANYFEFVPDDIRSMLKLADIYEKHNARDAAVMLYKHVMTIDPSNETAISRLEIR
jgi:tetratricopeptide (TPR) repeat protein